MSTCALVLIRPSPRLIPKIYIFITYRSILRVGDETKMSRTRLVATALSHLQSRPADKSLVFPGAEVVVTTGGRHVDRK